jgi:uncharacterized repeat protein (TIGR03803 family)
MKKKLFYLVTILVAIFSCQKQTSAQELWGMTKGGGATGGGVIFKYNTVSGIQTIVHSFEESTGKGPNGDLLLASNGSLYGLTDLGGANLMGVLFEFNPLSKTYTKKFDFDGSVTGSYPAANLIEASNHKLYGMTSYGGANDQGIIFEYDLTTGFQKIYDFSTLDGCSTRGSLMELQGILYGTAWGGGENDCGTLFKYEISSGTFSKLLDFKGGTDGKHPVGNLIEANGKLYGMTHEGGADDYGVLFEYNPASGTNPDYKVIHEFTKVAGGYAPFGSLYKAANGLLYGMTCFGGTGSGGDIFKFNPLNYSFEELFNFNSNDSQQNGFNPYGSLFQTTDGMLYGMTYEGGTVDVEDNKEYYGVLFAYDPETDSYVKKIDFNGGNGQQPGSNSLIQVEVKNPTVAVCKNTSLYLDANGNATLSPSAIDGGSTGEGITLSASKTSFSCTDIAANPNKVTLTVTDNYKNLSTCEAMVTVVDNSAPTVLCKNATVILDNSGNGTLTVAQVNNGSSDACGIKSMVVSKTIFSVSDLAANPNKVTLTVTDNNGNISSCEANVTVVDNSTPTVLCKNATVILDNSGNGTLTVAQVDNGSSDVHGIKSMALSRTSFSCNDITSNPNKVTLTVTNNNNTVSTCVANVTVVDNTAPKSICRNATVVLTNSGNGTLSAAQINNGSSDACGIKSMALSRTSFSCSDIATNPNKVTLTVTDNNNNVSTCVANVNVISDNSSVEVIANTIQPVQLGNKVSITMEEINSEHVNVDWNDNSSQHYTVKNNKVVASHTYTATGMYVVSASYTIPCGGKKTVQYKYVVVYDTEGGWVTGGGWISSPAGAFYSNKSRTAKAEFGFVAKYKKGTTEVEGNTEFQFSSGNLKFKSSSNEAMSLVIAGPKAIYKGKGTVNGTPGYSYMVSVIDGNLNSKGGSDKFRIKIWKTSTREILYDNLPGADDNADAATKLNGGSIVIHSKNEGYKSANISDVYPEPEPFDLRVYPNPFNDLLRFDFVPTADGQATIEIMDILGRKVSTVFDCPVEAGILYNAVFNPESIPVGVYIYRIKIGEKTTLGKVVYNKL